MARQVFNHDTTKKMAVVFATVFDEIRFLNGHGQEIPVPLMYSPREKWLEDIREKANMNQFALDITLPRMGFEWVGMNFAPERHVNPMARITDGEGNYTYNRIPYDIQFNLYIAATRINDGLRIVEQIIPFFTPELTLTVRDIQDLNLETNVHLVLTSKTHEFTYEGTFDQERILTWELNFTLKTYFYQDIKVAEKIKETIVNLKSADYEKLWMKLTSEVVPREADVNEPHIIVDNVEEHP